MPPRRDWLSRLLTVSTSLRQQGRDLLPTLDQAWIAHHGCLIVAGRKQRDVSSSPVE